MSRSQTSSRWKWHRTKNHAKERRGWITTLPHEVSLKPGKKRVLPTGWHLRPEEGVWLQAAHEEWGAVSVTAGLSIDQSGREEVVLVLRNDANKTVTLEKGKAIKVAYRCNAERGSDEPRL